jgi:WD40 repeat protein
MNFSNYSDNLLYSSFNHTNDCVIFGTINGFYVYTINPFKKIISRKITGGVSIVNMLYKSNIIAFVGNEKNGLYPNNKLIIWDDSKEDVIGEISFNEQILNFKLSKDIITVVVNSTIFIYNFKDLSIIRTYYTNLNNNGLCKIVGDLIIYPANNIGEITVINYKSNNDIKNIQCHENEIKLFTIDPSGKYLASCSTKGTIIRIYNIETANLVKELRRGSDYTKIIDLKFSSDLQYLLCSSEKGTIHIYNILLNEDYIENYSYISYFLPEYFNSEWSIIKFYIDTITYSCFMENDSNKIISIGSDGCFYNLSIDIEKKVGNIDTNYKFILDSENPFDNKE